MSVRQFSHSANSISISNTPQRWHTHSTRRTRYFDGIQRSKSVKCETRIEAALTLAKLHRLQVDQLSAELANLVKDSTPNRQRTFRGLEMASELDVKIPDWRSEHPELADDVTQLLLVGEPKSNMTTLVHGDFFSANILPSAGRTRIIDWDLFSVGDPMWDLGFLIGADRDIEPQETHAVIDTYGQQCPIDMETLTWHRRCWSANWRLRDLRKLSRARGKSANR